MYVVACSLFVIIAIAYFVQLWRLVAKLRADSVLWLRLGQPSLVTLSGQQTFDRILYRHEHSGITDICIIREINRTRWLQLAAVLVFAVVVITFLVGRAGSGA